MNSASGSNEGDSLPVFTELEYVPDSCDDPTFYGLAPEAPTYCHGHTLPPRKCVAFQGTDTGRRFYRCSVLNEVENCGFVGWVDPEHSYHVKTAIGKIWGMYEVSSSAAIDEKIEHARLMKELLDEKKKVEKKYNECIHEMNTFLDNSTKECMKANYARIRKEGKDDDMMQQMRITIDLLHKQVYELEEVHRCKSDEFMAKEQKWEEETKVLKEEKKKLEYSLYDLLKISHASEDKLKRMKAICDE